ncbi:MAG: DEAD/DEAH box helicase family protein [Hespellia sp.]|nr:DEAD/DEAH box helicase family protein [Hespellia sp.]
MDEVEMWHVPMQEKQELASKIYFFFRDEYGIMPSEVATKVYGYPDAEKEIIEHLSTPEGIVQILAQMDQAIEEIHNGEVTPRFRLIYKPEDIRQSVEELKREPVPFPSATDLEIPAETFITQDEIDYKLSRGSNVSEGLFRIYDYFLEGHTKKELADFLKQEYGTGGGSPALVGAWHSYADHDAKGLKLSKGSIFEPSAKILLTWAKVAERIQKLIDTDRFITPQTKEEYEKWKEKQEQKALEKAQAELQEEPAPRLVVAVENTEDYADPSIGFFTFHYQDGREGIRYRLVTIGEDGKLEAYPEANKFFINEVACREYIAEYSEKLRVISYDEIVQQAGENLKEKMEVKDISESQDIIEEIGEAEETEKQGTVDAVAENQEQSEDIEQSEDSLDLLEPDLDVPESKTSYESEIDTSQAVNYRITNDALTAGSAQEKFDRNIAAIMTLQLIENEKRTATPEEQEILAGYVGWGGLSEAFDERNNAWHDRCLTLKGLLNEQEYSAARESTLTAHYTSPVVIRSIYEALGNMGFEKGNVLEPSMGTGNFFGMLPEAMAQSRLYGVELDSLTGRIAKQLYPKARIQVTGFEKTDYPDDFFDVAVGNVPFGDYKVFDRKYDKYNLLIHDYFFAKSIDKVRQGGVVAMITSSGMGGGTFDKRDSRTRRYIAQRCDLLGAIRLPRGTFEDANLTTDILFFQKRERQRDLINEEPDWVQTTVVHESDFTKADGEVVKNKLYTNNYFLEHPEMVLGKQEVISGPFGPQLICTPTGDNLEEQLKEAVSHIQGSIESVGLDELEDELERTTIPADPDVKNYSYTVVDGEVYYREDSVMKPVEMSESMRERIKGMVAIRNATNDVIDYQLEEYGESAIKEKQVELSDLYDDFTKRFGLISSQTNKRAFNQDSSYCLLCSLEVLNEDGTLKRKADMFTKRTIKRQETVTFVDTPTEALAVSMSEKACVDIGYMAELLGGSDNYDRIVTELGGVIFKNPLSDLDDPYAGWETGDEYLSGNVREKLEIARLCAENHPEYTANVIALEQVQPKLLDASEIEVRLGATWVEPRYIDDFMQEVFETARGKFEKGTIGTQYSEISGQWNIRGKSADFGNPLTEATYGTGRANAYKILEDSLNLRDSRIFDTIMEDGKEKRVLNKKETMLVSQKQEAIREAYKDWIFRDAERREVLCKKYNELFNSNRPREYDGSHLTFPGMSPNIGMRSHQKNAVAHQLYGNNTLLAHCVGAGKTYEMAAAAMESKRLGLAQKSLFVVPNHLTGQWASEFLTLYPGANILAATKKDFEPANRKKFCSRIATGDYDAVIIGHSQFEKIPLSKERQAAMIERQVSDITLEIESLKSSHGERYTIKQMEKTKKSLLARLERLNDNSRKDDVVTFEQLGVDRLFVDESHSYKNCMKRCRIR